MHHNCLFLCACSRAGNGGGDVLRRKCEMKSFLWASPGRWIEMLNAASSSLPPSSPLPPLHLTSSLLRRPALQHSRKRKPSLVYLCFFFSTLKTARKLWRKERRTAQSKFVEKWMASIHIQSRYIYTHFMTIGSTGCLCRYLACWFRIKSNYASSSSYFVSIPSSSSKIV